MNILFINHFFVGFMVYEIPRVSVFYIELDRAFSIALWYSSTVNIRLHSPSDIVWEGFYCIVVHYNV